MARFDNYGRREILKKGIPALGATVGLSQTGSASSSSIDDVEVINRKIVDNREDSVVIKTVLKELDGYEENIRSFIWNLPAGGQTTHLQSNQAESERTGGVIETTDKSSEIETKIANGDDISAQDHWVPGYDWVLTHYKEFNRPLGQCPIMDYTHQYGGIALKLTKNIHAFSTTFVAGLITAACGAIGAGAGALTGTPVGAALGALGGGAIGAMASALFAIGTNRRSFTWGLRDYDISFVPSSSSVIANKWDPDVHNMVPGQPKSYHIVEQYSGPGGGNDDDDGDIEEPPGGWPGVGDDPDGGDGDDGGGGDGPPTCPEEDDNDDINTDCIARPP